MAEEELLSIEQRHLLLELASGKSVKDACAAQDISSRTFLRWQKQPAFSKLLDELFSKEDIANLKRSLNIVAGDTVEVLEEAMHEANRSISIRVTCPHCGKPGDHTITVEDWKARLHAVDTLLKISGILTERRETKMDINVTYQLNWAENLALMKWQQGQAISPAMEQRLLELGKIETRQLAEHNTVEGEYHEVPEPTVE